MARSVVFNGSSSAATVALPNSAPYNAIGDFRVELRIHNLAAQTGTIFRNDHYLISYNTATGNLSFFNLATAEAATVSISGKTDFIVRCRRVSSTGEISLEVWDADGTNRVAQTTTVATTGTKNWSTTTTYSFCIGATREPDTSTYSWQGCQIAWFRGRDASGSYNATAPADADAVGNLFSYEFEDNLNDTSGNTRHLTAVGTPTYATTPGGVGPPDPPVITLTPTSGQIAVSGSSASATGYKVYRRELKGSYNYASPLADVASLPYNDTTISNDRRYFYEVRAYNANGDSASSIEKVSSFHTTTVIDTENANTGTSAWQLSNPAAAREIEGYASLTSVNKGDSIDFHISSSQANYTIDIYRMGYYAGLGGRQIGSQISKTNGTVQTMPTAERNNTTPSLSRELVTCAWSVSHSYTVPSDAVSGIYLAKLTQTTSTKQSYIIFCVRDDSRSASLLYIQPVTTYQAYNNWGGKSLYGLNSVAVADTSDPLYGIVMNSQYQARAVSFSRPYAVTNRSTRTNAVKGIGAGDFLTMQDSDLAESTINASGWELDAIMWLESHGFDLKYITNVDQHTTPATLTAADVILSVGHDEYWTQEMRDNIISARDAGVHLNFLGANSAYWQARFEDSNRTLVCWKEDAGGDPETTLSLKTALWRFDSVVPTRTGRPEEAFVGVMWKGYNINVALKATAPTNWIYQGLTITDGQTLGSGLVGYEYDMVFDEGGASPDGLIVVFRNVLGTGDEHNGTVYETTGGAIIFAAGTNQFPWGLYSNPLAVTGFRSDLTQPNIQHLMLNVLDEQLNTITDITTSGPSLFRGRNFPFFDDDQVNRFEFWPAVTEAPTLVIQNATHAHTAQNASLTQVHSLAINNASHTHTAVNNVLTQAHSLALQNASHAHTAGSLALTQTHVLTIQNASHAHSAASPTLTQVHSLAVANAAHAHTGQNLTLSQAHSIVIADSAHPHTAQNVSVTISTALVVQSASHGHIAESLTLTGNHVLAVANSTHPQSAGDALLTQVHSLVVQDASHAQSAQSLILTQAHQLATASATHLHTAESLTFTQVHSLITQNANHSHTAENVEIASAGTLGVQSATHGHTSQNLTLTQVHALAVTNSDHTHTAENLTIAVVYQLAIQTADHQHSASTLSLTGTHNLTLSNSSHAHSADSLALTQIHSLITANATHGHSADNLAITEAQNLNVQSSTHAHSANSLTLTQAHGLIINDSAHVHSAPQLTLGLPNDLAIANSFHAHTARNISFTWTMPVDVFTIPTESNVFTVPADSRIFVVPDEERIFEV